MEFQHVLFPVDFSTACAQVGPWVLQIVNKLGCRLTLLNVWETPYVIWSGEIEPRLLEGIVSFAEMEPQQRTSLEEFGRAHLHSTMAELVIRKGDPAQQIVEYARATDVDLIMMPTHGYGRFRTALLGSVTAKVIHDSTCAVWTSAHIERLHSPPPACRLIICAVDGSEESIKPIRHAGLLAKDLESSLIVVHVIRPGKAEPESRLRSRLQGCEALAQVSVPIYMEKGEIVTVVRETAQHHNADLIVIGRGHAPEALGPWRSQVYPIIGNAPCPVLAI